MEVAEQESVRLTCSRRQGLQEFARPRLTRVEPQGLFRLLMGFGETPEIGVDRRQVEMGARAGGRESARLFEQRQRLERPVLQKERHAELLHGLGPFWIARDGQLQPSLCLNGGAPF